MQTPNGISRTTGIEKAVSKILNREDYRDYIVSVVEPCCEDVRMKTTIAQVMNYVTEAEREGAKVQVIDCCEKTIIYETE
jgi:hypothetical protein